MKKKIACIVISFVFSVSTMATSMSEVQRQIHSTSAGKLIRIFMATDGTNILGVSVVGDGVHLIVDNASDPTPIADKLCDFKQHWEVKPEPDRWVVKNATYCIAK